MTKAGGSILDGGAPVYKAVKKKPDPTCSREWKVKMR